MEPEISVLAFWNHSHWNLNNSCTDSHNCKLSNSVFISFMSFPLSPWPSVFFPWLSKSHGVEVSGEYKKLLHQTEKGMNFYGKIESRWKNLEGILVFIFFFINDIQRNEQGRGCFKDNQAGQGTHRAQLHAKKTKKYLPQLSLGKVCWFNQLGSSVSGSQTSRNLEKFPTLTLHPDQLSLGIAARYQYFLKLCRWFQWAAEGWRTVTGVPVSLHTIKSVVS